MLAPYNDRSSTSFDNLPYRTNAHFCLWTNDTGLRRPYQMHAYLVSKPVKLRNHPTLIKWAYAVDQRSMRHFYTPRGLG